MSGLIRIPSARMLDDGKLIIGASFIPKGYFKRTFGLDRENMNFNPGLNTYLTYGILPFVEVMFRYSHELNMRVNINTKYFPDRMFGLRVRVLNEKKILPSVVVGLQDPSSVLGPTCSICTNYSATYIVSNKFFEFRKGKLDLSLGFAIDRIKFNNKTLLDSNDFRGFFSGISYMPNFYDKISFHFEYDSISTNTGVKLRLTENILLMYGFRELSKPTFSFNYQLF